MTPSLRRDPSGEIDPGQRGALTHEAWVGAFVLAALLLAGYTTLRLAGSSLLEPGRQSYRVQLPSSGGVRAGDTVRVAGVEVGRITDLKLGDDAERPVALTIELDRGVRLSEDSKAFLGSDSLLGGSYLAIDPGRPGTPELEPGSSIDGESMQTLDRSLVRLEEVAERASRVLEHSERLMSQLADRAGPLLDGAEQMLGDDNQRNITASLDALRQTLETVGPQLESSLARIEQTAAQVGNAADAVPAVGEEVSALTRDLRATLANSVGPEGEELRLLVISAREALTRLDSTMATVSGNRGDLEATVRDLRDASANLKTLSESLATRPSSLFGLRSPPDRSPGDGLEREESP